MNRVPQFLLSIGRVTTPWARVLYTDRMLPSFLSFLRTFFFDTDSPSKGTNLPLSTKCIPRLLRLSTCASLPHDERYHGDLSPRPRRPHHHPQQALTTWRARQNRNKSKTLGVRFFLALQLSRSKTSRRHIDHRS
ncbi:uncharacterized protein H6S33_006288 [Morchella sextelata]|uniref:uncharacterized protein n=1 Tax=Morchella sextelata TaxID=1174677 RepID=UPI001D04FF38|nr:uncharacterized protein H6S33_006288 [Morchella sextelata]KAH0604620.1 hypothetical protein H6S33_006288 [Morchella sextelata]